MSEPAALARARRRLAQAESELATADGLARLREGLELLEQVVEEFAGAASADVARNLGSAYAKKIHARIDRMLEQNANLPEPELEHLFAVARAFDDSCAEAPPSATQTKIELVRRLIDLYCEGYDPVEKEKAYEQLARLARV